jgi:hypothetical protein
MTPLKYKLRKERKKRKKTRQRYCEIGRNEG